MADAETGNVGEKPFALLEPRKKVSEGVATAVTVVLKLDLLFRLAVILAIGHLRGFGPYDLGPFIRWDVLMGLQLETFLMCVLLITLGRWENQEHWITVWQTLGSIQVVMLRMGLFAFPGVLALAFAGLFFSYYVGIYSEFAKEEPARLPPFVPKKNDVMKPKYGWLGESLSKWIPSRCKFLRLIVTLFIYLGGRAFTFFIIYAFFISMFDDLRDLPTFDYTDSHTLYPLLWVSVLASCVTIVPYVALELATIPGLLSDWRVWKRASRSYNTGVMDVCELDGDDEENSELRKKMREQPEGILPLTIVLPCYMPNESEILGPVLDWYEAQLLKYPADSRVLIVYNSPHDHPFEAEIPEVTGQLQARQQKWLEWKAEGKSRVELQFERNTWSTSKCDNLNLACEGLIQTEICCLNDADTMLDWATMVRGSYRLHEGYDIAQASNTHNRFDRKGTPGDEGETTCHPYGFIITIGDSTKPGNMATQSQFDHAPFNGRGGFWRTSAVKLVGFDHRTIGEDHDAGYRACAYFGAKGILDPNMICQEQEPPDCKSLTSQRIRWETAGLQMRRTFNWVLRSPFYSRWECFVLIWSQLGAGCNLPFQALPLQVAAALPLLIMKGYVSILVLGDATLPHTWRLGCQRDDCETEFEVMNWKGQRFVVALPVALVLFGGALLLWICLSQLDFWCRVGITRYQPKLPYLCYFAVLQYICAMPFFFYVQYWALFDYCWGGGKFIATARSSLSAKSVDNEATNNKLTAPLLGNGEATNGNHNLKA